MKRKLFAIIAVAVATFALILTAASSGGRQYVGYVSMIKGVVYITSGGKRTRALAKRKLYTGDYLSTMSGSYATLKLGNGSYMKLKAGTKLMLNKNHAAGSALSVGVNAGSVSAKINPAAKQKVKVSTPSSIAAIKGTEFNVTLAIDGSTLVNCDSGKLNVKVNVTDGSAAGDDASVDIGANEGGQVNFGEETAGVKKQEVVSSEEASEAFVSERMRVVQEDPAGTMKKMRNRMESVQGKNQDVLMKAKMGELKPEDMIAVDEQLHANRAMTSGIAELATRINKLDADIEAFERKLMQADYDFIMKVHKAEEELNAKIEAALERMNW